MATPVRNFRVSDELWRRASERAKQDGLPLTEIIRVWLYSYGNHLPVVAPNERVRKLIQSAIDANTAALEYFDESQQPPNLEPPMAPNIQQSTQTNWSRDSLTSDVTPAELADRAKARLRNFQFNTDSSILSE